jgi:signal transduction histidine kinase
MTTLSLVCLLLTLVFASGLVLPQGQWRLVSQIRRSLTQSANHNRPTAALTTTSIRSTPFTSDDTSEGECESSADLQRKKEEEIKRKQEEEEARRRQQEQEERRRAAEEQEVSYCDLHPLSVSQTPT